jgi:ergothioneine biosynthesis protein EgtB
VNPTRTSLIERYLAVRTATEELARPLSPGDQQVQSMPSASPTKWHRAHTTWFFEAFILGPAGIPACDDRFAHLFNSYYDTLGDRIARPKRGLITRPTADEIGIYRRTVDGRMVEHLQVLDEGRLDAVATLVELGCQHEEQHQELMLTDVLHAFSENPTAPAYRPASAATTPTATPAPAPDTLTWRLCEGGVVSVGAPAGGFAFDNERPRHPTYLAPFEWASRPVTVGEVRAFIAAGGYETPSLWLSDGWDRVRAEGWRAPLYAACEARGDGYRVFGLRGLRVPDDAEPASHLSFWEAEAIARFLGARLPTEQEWEHAAGEANPRVGNFADGPLTPVPAATERASGGEHGPFGDVWQWTRSSHSPYPGYRPPPGAVGEYNGKFMAQQYVLRGGSCLTPRGHLRASYRNFWHPDTRFQMSGLRLVRDL